MRRTTIQRRAGTRLALLGALLAVLAVLSLAANPDGAAACERLSLNGDVRRCTLSESFVQCIRDSEDAYWQCRRRNPGFWGAMGCSFANNIDHIGCFVSSGVFAATRPFVGG